MAAPMRRICATTSLIFRGYLAQFVQRQTTGPSHSVINYTTWCKNATKFLAVPVRRLCTQEAGTADTVHKHEELSDADVAAGIAYIQSEEYNERYGGRPVFANYRRNHKGGVPPKRTRLTCTRGKDEKRKVSGNPCPICRDENLVLHYKNVKLLEQFICPHSREVYSDARTGVCQKQYKKLQKAIAEARAYGLIPFTVPFVHYDYKEYYSKKEVAKTS